MRKKKYSDKRIHALRELHKRATKERFELVEKPSVTLRNMASVHVVRGIDLRATLEEKALDCHQHAGWTAFVNRAGNLVHILPKEGDFHIRLPLYFSTAKCTDGYVERLIQTTIHGRLK